MNGTEIIFEVEESPEGGFEARALGHAIFTEATPSMSSARWFATPCVATSTPRRPRASFVFTW